MVHMLSGLLAALQLMLPLSLPHLTAQQLHSGQWLRMHVVAHDDTPEMQRVKLCVRDAVQACYLENHSVRSVSMQEQTASILHLLQESAVSAARLEGFTGEVRAVLDNRTFGMRSIGSIPVPAGDYPALTILLGDAAGQNWWGLIDPEMSLLLACVAGGPDRPEVIWDWSWQAFWAALLGLPLKAEGA